MPEQFPHLFSPIKVGTMTAPNRIVETPHGIRIGRADGLPDDANIAYEVAKAKGGVGWIAHSGIYVNFPVAPGFQWTGALSPYMAASNLIDRPDFVPRFKRFVDAIHEHGSVLTQQIIFLTNTLGPSPIQSCRLIDEIPHQMSREEIRLSAQAYGVAAARVRETGMDGVEIHAAHDCVPEWFLSPLTNKRTDEYGGSVENRLRFVIEIIDAIRAAVGRDYTVGIRLNADQFREGGYDLDDMKQMATILARTGKLDFLSMDVGTYWGNPSYIQPMYYPLGAFVYTAAAIKQVVDIPVLFAGRINDVVQAEKVLADGQADLVAMVRASIADPEFPRKAREGRLDEIRKCLGCNHCIRLVVHHFVSGRCAANPMAGHELDWGQKPAPDVKKRVVVVGGGPDGMEAARVAASRGHQVTLIDKNAELGGQLLIAAKAPLREGFLDLPRYQAHQARLLGIDVRLNTEATPEMILGLKPDAVLVATGSRPRIPDIRGVNQPNVVQLRDVLEEKVQVGQRVVVACEEDHYEGVSVCDFLAARGKDVEILHHWTHVGADVERYSRSMMLFRLHSAGVKVTTSTGVKAIEGNAVVAYDTHTGEERRIEEVDTVVLAYGSQGDSWLYEALKGKVKELHIVGSAYAPRQVLEATHQGAAVGYML
ncbi:MAG: FAD-dependent oxidoreductase [Chloroflexi bacterium]|nr:FAD-dependent oxidoreductase [Chloroflexota bacterium]